VESNIHQYYENDFPGQVVVLGADLFNCTPSSLGTFAQNTGTTYPLLLNAATSTGGNIQSLYGERDHYVVINKQGIVRYQANDRWPYGNGYHLDEIRGCVDTLVTSVVGVGEESSPTGVALRVGPSPFRSGVAIVLANSTARALEARVTVHDLLGRLVATLLDGPAAPGLVTLRWDGRDLGGRAVASGIYQVRAEVAGARLARRVALVR
jgi:hypothetical protein